MATEAMGRPRREEQLSEARRAAIVAFAVELRAQCYGWNHIAEKVRVRFRSTPMGWYAIRRLVEETAGDPQAEMDPDAIRDKVNERRSEGRTKWLRSREGRAWRREHNARARG